VDSILRCIFRTLGAARRARRRHNTLCSLLSTVWRECGAVFDAPPKPCWGCPTVATGVSPWTTAHTQSLEEPTLEGWTKDVSWITGLVDPFGVRTVSIRALLPWVATHGYYWAAPYGATTSLEDASPSLGNAVLVEAQNARKDGEVGWPIDLVESLTSLNSHPPIAKAHWLLGPRPCLFRHMRQNTVPRIISHTKRNRFCGNHRVGVGVAHKYVLREKEYVLIESVTGRRLTFCKE
jgi:hypothetical protein